MDNPSPPPRLTLGEILWGCLSILLLPIGFIGAKVNLWRARK